MAKGQGSADSKIKVVIKGQPRPAPNPQRKPPPNRYGGAGY